MRISLFLMSLVLAALLASRGEAALDLPKGFATPPDSARPWVIWFWLNGNVTKEGITADLEAMHSVGLGGAEWMWGGGVGGDVAGPVKFLDSQFWDLLKHTIKECDRLGLKLNLTNGSGWSHSGGPWIQPEHSMRRLEMSQEFRLTGPQKWETTVPLGDPLVAVAAYPVLPSGKDTLASKTSVELTSSVDKHGHLVWEVPAGDWSVQILCHVSTGERPHPVLSDAGGWECDKLSPEAVEENWKGFVLRVLNECGPAARRVVRYVHADSYEFGVQTWTPVFPTEFQKRCGYDPLPYLPAVLGKTVDDPDTSARFLWDFRRVRADLFAEGIGGRFRDLARSEGLTLTTEPHDIPEVFDSVQYGRHVGQPMGNFLAERRTQHYAPNPPLGPEVHLAKGEASAAYTYGLDGVVWAEAFTGVDHAHAWKETPGYLRTWGDLWLTEGINRFCFHCWAHSPSLTQKPGITLGPWGIHFDRRNTWFSLAGGYITYLSRAQFMLQQGLPVVDVCVFTGDDVTARLPQHPSLRASGYDYHGITAEVLQRATVKDGLIVLPSGMRYRLLASYNREMRPETVRKLRELVTAGAVVIGEKPLDAPGLVGFPESRSEVREIADEMWGSDPAEGERGRAFGKGRVFWGQSEVSATPNLTETFHPELAREADVLRKIGVYPDFEYELSGKENGDNMLAYAHRRVGDTDIYFVSNQSIAGRYQDCVFRVSGKQPELWDAVAGEIRDLSYYREREGRVVVPLIFEGGQSFFIVFRKSKLPPKQTNEWSVVNVGDIDGPWKVSFDPKWGGPDKPVTFAKLEDWSKRPEEGIRHYSGQAAYRKTFTLRPQLKGKRIYLSLGPVRDVAEVRVNGQSVGTVWCAPWRVEITRALRKGSNDLEIVVANQWVNRLIGDSGLPEEKRFTWTTWNPYKPDSPLLESGLMGPVSLQVRE